jgi:hypothetical protein
MFREKPGDTDQVWHTIDPTLSDYRVALTRMLTYEINWGVLAPLYRRTFLERVGPFAGDLYTSDEREFQVRALCRGPAIVFLPETLAYVRLQHSSPESEGSKGRLYSHPPQLKSRLRARRYIWRALRQAGLDTPPNRRGLLPALVVIAREMAGKRMVQALSAWAFAMRVAPDMSTRVKLLSIALPGLLTVLVTGRAGHRLPPLFRRFGLEREIYNA